MSPWHDDRFFKASPKKPPPEHGIKIKKAGTTWWGQRWTAALEHVLAGQAGRLQRGRTYARAGRTHDLVVKSGKVTALVTGSRATPYRIEIKLAALSGAIWDKALCAMAEKAQFAAELLEGRMPAAIDEVFLAAGSSLFPRERTDLVASCSCPDWGDPCKHVAATHYVLGEAFDRDPFLLFELRGRTKSELLAALRKARGREGASREQHGAAGPEPVREREVASVVLGKIDAAAYDQPREPVPALSFAFEGGPVHGAVLRQLGAPAAWTGSAAPADVLAPIVRAAAERARNLSAAELPAAAAPEPPPTATAPSKPGHAGKPARKKAAKVVKRRIR